MPYYKLTEDAATAESCRSQLWQWSRHGERTEDGRLITGERFDLTLNQEIEWIHKELGARSIHAGQFSTAVRLLPNLVKDEAFAEFLKLSAYELLQ